MPPLLTGILGASRGGVEGVLQSMPCLQNIFKSPDDKSQFFTCIASCNLANSLKNDSHFTAAENEAWRGEPAWPRPTGAQL